LTLTFRTLAGDDPVRYLSYEPAAISDVRDRFDRYLSAGNYRPEWLWVAERDGDVLARAAFWGRPDDASPVALDHFDIRPGLRDADAVGAGLLTAVYAEAVTPGDDPPDHHLFLPPHWRDHPEAPAVHSHLDAAERAGLHPLVERHRLRWTPALSLTEPANRLTMQPATDADDGVLVDLLVSINEGSLDVGMSREADEHGAVPAARSYVDDMTRLDAERTHWLLGYDATDVPVGLAVGALLPDYALVGFVGVVPAHRGRGHALELLCAVTRRLADAGARECRADTDLTNIPMATTFARAGWEVWGTRLVLQGPRR
jgi:GNAT superfamily N-acetyltransferase